MENMVYDGQRSSLEDSAAAPAAPKAGAGFEKALVVILWLIVGFPLLWGIFKTLQVVQYLFR
jgi:hypothetical protein